MARKVINSTYRPGPLATPADLRRELARLYRDARQRLMPASDARQLAGIIAIMGRLIENSETEQRLEVLEEIVRERHGAAFSAH
jgi:hypothetical protein